MKQSEADRLIKIAKYVVDTEVILPLANECRDLKVLSVNKKEEFLVYLNRKGRIELHRCTYQMSRKTREILVRVDLDLDKSHQNPSYDGKPEELIRGPHVHLYKEGYGDRIAYPLDEIFPGLNPLEIEEAFKCFSEYCNITDFSLQGRWAV